MLGFSVAHADGDTSPLLLAANTKAQSSNAETSVQTSGTKTSILPSNAVGLDGNSQSIFKFNGFGTLATTHSSQRDGDYVPDSILPSGAGRSSEWSTSNDSRLGLHVAANISPKISAVLQVISEYQADNSYNPEVEWFNIKYSFNPDFFIRIGRIALPAMLYSDSRDVGYSFPWIHPPVDVYRELTITHSDGIDAMYRWEFEGYENTVKVILGQNVIDRPNITSTEQGLRGIVDTVEYGPALFKVGYHMRESSFVNLQTGISDPWVMYTDLSLGASYDPGEWFVLSEWLQRQSTTKVDSMYVTSGARIEKFTPYITYSTVSAASFFPSTPTPTATSILSSLRSQSTVSLGMRWDFMKKTDLKVQYDQVRLSSNSNGYLINVARNAVLYGDRIDLISLAVDFVF